jgi:hypothetical protein
MTLINKSAIIAFSSGNISPGRSFLGLEAQELEAEEAH